MFFLHAAEEACVAEADVEALHEAEGAVDAQNEQHEEEEPDPMLPAGEGAQRDGPAAKDETEARNAQIRNLSVFEDREVPEDG